MMTKLSRRNFLKVTGGLAAASMAAGAPGIVGAATRKVVVIGGGYGGAIAAKYIKMADANLDVTLIEKDAAYVSCPLSNPVIVGLRDISVQTWGYDGLKKHGINVVHDLVTGIDPAAKKVTTKGGQTFDYERLVVSPGVEMRLDAIEGYDAAAEEVMPHAWKAGPQTLALRDQLQAMKDGDPFVIVAPPDPFRCPPGPYERASLVAWYLMKNKPKSKVIILDPKDKFAKSPLFTGGWKELGYPIEWVPGAEGGKVSRVDAKTLTVYTEMAEYKGGVVNVIPPMRANLIAQQSGLTDESGWCPVDVSTFESTLHKGIHVIGDACIAKGLPKSGYSANSEAKITAAAVVNLLNDKPVGAPSYVNTCYSLISPDYGISVALVANYKDGAINKTSGGVSPAKASAAFRKQEAQYAESWYQSIMADSFS
jgi:sulfide dehydrogenase [flavocytochrome c] flavoprotein subunit